LYEDQVPKCRYIINDHEYKIGYLLFDEIYLKWATFFKTILFPQGLKAKHFAECRVSLAKDAE